MEISNPKKLGITLTAGTLAGIAVYFLCGLYAVSGGPLCSAVFCAFVFTALALSVYTAWTGGLPQEDKRFLYTLLTVAALLAFFGALSYFRFGSGIAGIAGLLSASAMCAVCVVYLVRYKLSPWYALVLLFLLLACALTVALMLHTGNVDC